MAFSALCVRDGRGGIGAGADATAGRREQRGGMNTVFTVVTVAVAVGIAGLAAWVFLVAPFVVPGRHAHR